MTNLPVFLIFFDFIGFFLVIVIITILELIKKHIGGKK